MITSLGCASEYLSLISFIDEITPEPLLIVVFTKSATSCGAILSARTL